MAHGDDDVVEADPGSGLSPAGPELEGQEDEQKDKDSEADGQDDGQQDLEALEVRTHDVRFAV